jgi:hypothetical protein
LSDLAPKVLTFETITNKNTSEDTTMAKKITINKGFTSTEWRASGLWCRNDKMHEMASKDPVVCNI